MPAACPSRCGPPVRSRACPRSLGVGELPRPTKEQKWSGRPGSNRRRPAWEAGILPLNYSRPSVLSVFSSLQATYIPKILSIQSILSIKYPLFGPHNRQ